MSFSFSQAAKEGIIVKAEILPDDERSFLGNMNEMNEDRNVDEEVSLQSIPGITNSQGT